uniref:Quattro n=1 Tax=Hucho hucho TaxID=62062 RepID=A0A4W5NZX9_9TELE
MENTESLDSSIQSALSALFPPFEATAPTVLSQLFRTIEERYRGDALHCLLDFLIPSKHLLEIVQQAACAAYSDVLFRCEGWPLCLSDRIVIQLASLNPLLLRPGDFYLQVEPFGEQAARIVLKSLLEEGCREMEETPIPETSYPCIFTLDWLREVNDGRHGTPLSRCLLSTDQGVMKVPWAQVAIPEFLDKPKTMTTPSVIRDFPFEQASLQIPSSSDSTSSALSPETMILPARDGISVSLRLMDGTSKLIKGDHEKPVPKPRAKPPVKPVGWVSPNTWDTSRNYCEVEGDYVDLVDFTKEKESLAGCSKTPNSSTPPLFKPVRPPPPVPLMNSTPCGRTLRFSEEPCMPCSQRRLGQEPSGQELKCRYRDSYLAALRNPVPFERGSIGLLATLEESGPCEGEEMGFWGPGQDPGECCNHYKEPIVGHEPHQHGHFGKEPPLDINHIPHKSIEPAITHKPGKHTKETQIIHKLCQGEPHLQTHHMAHQTGPDSKVALPPAISHPVVVDACKCDYTSKPIWNPEAVKTIGKHKTKPRSLSTVSEKARGSPLVHKLYNRSHSDICPEMIPPIETRTIAPPNRPDTKPQSPKTKPSAPPIQPPSPVSCSPPSPSTQHSIFRSISGLLHLGIVSLPGSRDRVGRSVLEIHGDRQGWMSPLLSAHEVCKVLLYLHSIPRKEVRDLGMTVVIDARKKPPPSFFYKALQMVQEQALHAVRIVLMLVDKDTSPRPERHPGLQMDMVTSLKALHKLVEGQQLTSDLGGTFPYSHTDWLQFHQKLISFVSDLQGAAHILHRAIKKIDGNPKMDTTQDVQLCIQDQKTSMKEVLQDIRLVTLQREGGAILARMRREEFRFAKSDDYSDALESVTVLYNQVEESVHMLVMRSNESLQHLDFLLKLREAESNLDMVEGEQQLMVSNSTEDTLESVSQALQHFGSFLTQAKEKKQQTLTLMMEVEKILGPTNSNTEMEVFRTVMYTFKSNMADFLLRAEKRCTELDNMVYVHRFCEQVAALAKECRQYLEQVETGCYPAKANLSTLKTYKERLGDCFSARHFQTVKAKAYSARGSGGMRLWNAAWIQCQEVSQRLGERLQQRGVAADKDQQQPTAGGAQVKSRVLQTGKEREEEKEEVGAPCSLAPASTFPPGMADNLGRASRDQMESRDSSTRDSAHITCFNLPIKADSKGGKGAKEVSQSSKSPGKEGKLMPVVPQDGGGGPGRRHSEADLKRGDPISKCEAFPWKHSALGRSLSEGSCMSSLLSSECGFSPLSARHSHSRHLVVALQSLQNPYDISRNGSFCSGHSCCKSNGDREGGDPIQVSSVSLTDPSGDETQEATKLQRIMEELLLTEREYVRSLGYVREHYFSELERPDVPQDLRGQGGNIFGNLEKLHDFHRHHFLKELEGCLQEPFRVGRCFLRHRESFGLYALFSKNKPQSDSLLINHGHDFFKQKQLQLGDKMDLSSYLLKPVQRISKYSLLLQDMVRECGPHRSREEAEVQHALEVIQFQLRHGNNLLAMDDIQDCDVNLKEQGQLIHQDEFLVSFRKKKCFRHVFLFQDLVLFSKTKRTDVGNDTYVYKQSFKTSDIGMTHNSGDSGLCFEIWFRRRKSQDTYTLQAGSREVKDAWTKDLERILWEQAVHNREIHMQERVFMGIGNKPFMDIQPSDAAINDRAVNCALASSGTSGLLGGFPVLRPNSFGSGSCLSTSGSHSSSSSGRGSLSSPTGGYLCGPKLTGAAGGQGGYSERLGVLDEDDMDQERGSQNLLSEWL